MRIHPTRAVFLLCLAVALLLLGGCLAMPRMLGGGGGDVSLNLDGEQKHELSTVPGRRLALEMRDPTTKGYELAGASFNTDQVRLEGIEQGEPVGRVRYLFTTLRSGDSDIQIKIRKAGMQPELFKFVTVKVE